MAWSSVWLCELTKFSNEKYRPRRDGSCSESWPYGILFDRVDDGAGRERCVDLDARSHLVGDALRVERGPQSFNAMFHPVGFFADALQSSWHDMLAGGHGTPMGEITVRFHAPSRLGDVLDFALNVSRIGRASADLHLSCTCAGEPRFTARATIVHAALPDARAASWPAPLRDAMARHALPPQTEKKSA